MGRKYLPVSEKGIRMLIIASLLLMHRTQCILMRLDLSPAYLSMVMESIALLNLRVRHGSD